jgi:antitoxin HicB
MNLIKYQAKLTKESEGGYSVTFPDVPGCFTDGDTIEEALINAKEALSLHLEESVNPKWDVPTPKERKGRNLYWVTPEFEIAIPLTIRQLRRDKNMSQPELAKKLNMKTQQYQKLEYPRKSNPTAKILFMIDEALGA